MSLLLEPSAAMIKEQKLYREMGLTDEEFARIEAIFGETAELHGNRQFLPSCGRSIAATKTRSRC